jgi:hypothetical protein
MLGLVSSVVAVSAAMAIHVHIRSKEAMKVLDDMEAELKVVHHQFNEADISKQQAERAIDAIIDRYQVRYLIYMLADKTEVITFFEDHRKGNKKLLGYPA